MVRLWGGLIALASMGACTQGINAGEQGGDAFVAFTAMLVITGVIMWIVLGRED